MKKLLLAFAALVLSASAFATVTVTQEVSLGYVLKRDAMTIGTPHTTEGACWTAAAAHAQAAGRSGNYWCPMFKGRRLTYSATPVACTTQPSVNTATIACPAGATGSWQQTTTVTVSAACVVTTTILPAAAPAGACTTTPPTGPTVYFSDCQPGAAAGCVAGDNTAPGTQAEPKRDLTGFDYNAAATGTQLLFKRGGAWTGFNVQVQNPNATTAAPFVFGDYGSGALPLLQAGGQYAFQFGKWSNRTDDGNMVNDGGYVLRNLKLDGGGTVSRAIHLRNNVHDVTIDGVEMTGFTIAIESGNDSLPGISNFALRNSAISANSEMGLLGDFNGLLIEGTSFVGNNFSGSSFAHAIYLSGHGTGAVIRNNTFTNNSAVNGVCTGGNVTIHGQWDGILIEGNTINQVASTGNCWGISVTDGYGSAEFFRNAVVRGNTINRLGAGIVARATPGVLIESNKIRNSLAGGYGIIVQSASAEDDPSTGAVVRNNTLCAEASFGSTVGVPGDAVNSGNSVQAGANATTGACAP